MAVADKSLFQSRRQLANLQQEKPPEKEKRNLKKFIPRVTIQNKKKAMIIAAGVVIVILGAGFGYYQYLLSQEPGVIYAKKLQSMTQVVGQQVMLPANEKPVVATVTDITKLPKEAFFEDAKDGDKILMYKKSKKAILYRPTTSQVIAVATLDFENEVPTTTPPPGSAVAGASTSAVVSLTTPTPSSASANFIPQGKILVQPQN